MNIREYISSGIVESYVLGLATEQERIEFEKLCLQYPELLAARTEFEINLEKQAFEKAITPPGHLKERIWIAINNESVENDSKVIAMDTTKRNSSWLRFVAAASVILLLGSAFFAYDQFSKNAKLEISASQLQSKLDSLNSQMANQQKMMDMVTNPGVTVVNMVGTEPRPASASIYWDSTSTDVFMVVKNIPSLPTEKQYQLWAFIDGKPVDLGLFDADKNNVILKMKNTQRAEAFAITIEDRGNGPIPKGPVAITGKPAI